VATGTAAVAIEIARRTGSGIVGLDQSEPMVREGARRVSRVKLTDRIHFTLGSGDRLPFADGSFDGVTFAYLLRYVDDVGSTLRVTVTATNSPNGKSTVRSFRLLARAPTTRR
jgi:demethylmenaquinone methyltransferase / 2-methoxy-6-polyprenyl-1,4-benzoquinol methylase